MADKKIDILRLKRSPVVVAMGQESQFRRRGIVLLVTLVILVVLTVVSYTLTGMVSRECHRQQYMIDYQSARYGCDSAAKYIFAAMEDMPFDLVSRPNEPDFSDLFALDEEHYNDFLLQWYGEEELANFKREDVNRRASRINDINDSNSEGIIQHLSGMGSSGGEDTIEVRGPYGPVWPFITKPVELKIGEAKVRIEIEDENAKYPVSWALLDDQTIEREVGAGLQTFFEWMDVNEVDAGIISDELEAIRQIKPFKMEYKPITEIKKSTAGRDSQTRRGRRESRTKATTITIPPTVHNEDIAKLLHSSLMDLDLLGKETVASERRKESALKYIGLWGTGEVNVNTAPRQVLEATFTFGGESQGIAKAIIERRRIKPFTDIEDLKKNMTRYTDSIKKCEKYITFKSKIFTIKVTAASGIAKASTIIAVSKDGTKVEQIAIMSG